MFEHLQNRSLKESEILPLLNKKKMKYLEFQSYSSKKVYYRLGIIDFLQKYGKRKKIETEWVKRTNKLETVDTISCVSPDLYADRFYKFMKEHLFT